MPKEVLVKRDLLTRLDTKYITVPKIPVTVTFEPDAKFLKLAAKAMESFKLQQLTDVANKYLDKAEKDITQTVVKVEREIDAMWEEEAYATLAKANKEIKAAVDDIEAGACDAVTTAWNKLSGEPKLLSDFKKTVFAQATFSLLTISASLAATFATHGSTTLVFVAACKSACDTATQIARAFEDLDSIGNKLAETMETLQKTVEKDLNGFADMAKGAATVISPALGNFMASTKRAGIELQAFKDKLADADKQSDILAKKVNDALAKAAKLNHDKMSKEDEKKLQVVEAAINKLLNENQDRRKFLDEANDLAKSYQKALDDYDARNPKFTRTIKFTRAGKLVAAAVAVIVDVITKVAPALA
ncbi:MAG TPA: hypothetical protein VKS60_11115 [Stellaceae bacterium]|nr:hypothetical protein [Stellaceae bacterium]